MESFSIFQLEVNNLLQSSGWNYLLSRYDKVIDFKSSNNEVVIKLSKGYYYTGLYIRITPKVFDIYKTTRENEIDTLRHMFGFNNGNTTVSTGKVVADLDSEYFELNKYVVEPLYFKIYRGLTYNNLIQIIDKDEVLRVTEVRENRYNTMQYNRTRLHDYLKKLTLKLGGNYGTDYKFKEMKHSYLSLSNYYHNISSEFLIENDKGEQLIIVGYNSPNVHNGMRFLISKDISDDYLYELREVLVEIRVHNNFMLAHETIIEDRLKKYLKLYEEHNTTKTVNGGNNNEIKKTKKHGRGNKYRGNSRRLFGRR